MPAHLNAIESQLLQRTNAIATLRGVSEKARTHLSAFGYSLLEIALQKDVNLLEGQDNKTRAEIKTLFKRVALWEILQKNNTHFKTAEQKKWEHLIEMARAQARAKSEETARTKPHREETARRKSA
ncbi:MAG: hypothetical protein ACRCYO_14020 [Bacteroidia bacterium]